MASLLIASSGALAEVQDKRAYVKEFHLDMPYARFQSLAQLPSEAELLKRLADNNRDIHWRERGIFSAHSNQSGSNYTLHLTEKRCRQIFPQLATPGKGEDEQALCMFTFSKPTTASPHRLSQVSVRFAVEDLEALMPEYVRVYGSPRIDRNGQQRVFTWTFQVENNPYRAQIVVDGQPGQYRFELSYNDLYRGGVRNKLHRSPKPAPSGAGHSPLNIRLPH